MELEIGSDDDLFLEEKDVSAKESPTWSPKQCEPLSKKTCGITFTEETKDSEDCAERNVDTERAQILSYEGDFLYSRKHFALALTSYQKGLALVPLRYVQLRRIFIEGAARCCVHLEEHDLALNMATMILEESLTLEHRMTAHSLLATVHAAAGNHKEAIKSLQACIQWQRSNVHFWLKLAQAYSALSYQSQHALPTQRPDSEPCPSCSCCCACASTISIEGEFTSDSSGIGPHVEPSLHVATDDIQPSSRDHTDGRHENSTSSNSPPRSVKHYHGDNKLKPVTLPLHKTHSGASQDTVNDKADPDTDSLSDSMVSKLLDKLDVLAITGKDASETCNDQAKDKLMCKECRPTLYYASSLLRARLLLKSVAHSVGSFAKVRNGQLIHQVEQSLTELHLHPDVIAVLHYHARQIVRKGCHRLDEDVSVTSEEGGEDGDGEKALGDGDKDLSTEEFEQRWFPWILKY